jgi:hypothetical protein
MNSTPCKHNGDLNTPRCLTHGGFMFSTKDTCEAQIDKAIRAYIAQPKWLDGKIAEMVDEPEWQDALIDSLESKYRPYGAVP